MTKKVLKFLSAFLVLSLIGTTSHASTLEKTEDKDIIEVEVLINSNDENFAENIVFDDGTKLSDYEYEVKYTALPRGFYPIADYFDYAAWITRDGVVSLSVDPKDTVRNSKSQKDAAWNVLSSTTQGFGSSSNWKNTKVMGWQFDCHYWFANSKSYWNLEPHRTASSYMAVVAAGCNP